MCDTALFEKDFSGQIVLVTGGNSGIGLTTAGQLAAQGATVIIGCRRLAAGEAVANDLNSTKAKNGGSVTAMTLDLASLASVREFASAFNEKYSALNVLVNNAGVMNTDSRKTADGFDMQLGTNHFGHFLLTNLLTDKLRSSAPSRVVNLSSCYHNDAQGRTGHIDFDDLNFEKRKYDGWTAYSQSKLANLLHARELAKRLPEGVTAYSVHPGFVRSNLINNTLKHPIVKYIASPFLKAGNGMIEPWEGAQVSLHCILSDASDLENGAYYAQSNSPAGSGSGGWPLKSPLAEANDDEVSRRLWEESERLVSGG